MPKLEQPATEFSPVPNPAQQPLAPSQPPGQGTGGEDKRTPEYLSELLRDKKLIELLKHTLPLCHVERLLEDGIFIL